MIKSIKNFPFLILLSFIGINIKAQLAPAIEWQRITWAPTGMDNLPQTQNQSADDWWYSNKNLYDVSGITQTGYVTVGYSTFPVTAANDAIAAGYYNETVGASISCFNPYPAPPYGGDCEDLFPPGTNRAQFQGNVAINDLNGNITKYLAVSYGDLQEVIQDGNFIYVVGLHVGNKNLEKTSFLSYNPTSANPTNYFDPTALGGCTGTPKFGRGHIYVAKLDLNLTKQWEFIYGYADYFPTPINAFNAECISYDLIKNSQDGNIYVIGKGMLTNTSLKGSAILLKIDPNGNLLQKGFLPLPLLTNSHGNSVNDLQGKSIVEIGTTGNMAIGAIGEFNTLSGPNSTEAYEAFVYGIDQTLNPLWPNPVNFSATNNGNNKNSNIWEIKYHKINNEILAAVVGDCIDCEFTGNNIAVGKIYRITPAGAIVGTPSSLGNVHGYDLRVGVEETSDGGFVAVSSTDPLYVKFPLNIR